MTGLLDILLCSRVCGRKRFCINRCPLSLHCALQQAHHLQAAENLARQLRELESEWKRKLEEKLTQALLSAEASHQVNMKDQLSALESSLKAEAAKQVQALEDSYAPA
jgi:hypothetical protein